jgi:hypothetical protein
MLDTLASLEQRPLSLSSHGRVHDCPSDQVEPTGVPRFLTTIISSSLHWIEDEDARGQLRAQDSVSEPGELLCLA